MICRLPSVPPADLPGKWVEAHPVGHQDEPGEYRRGDGVDDRCQPKHKVPTGVGRELETKLENPEARTGRQVKPEHCAIYAGSEILIGRTSKGKLTGTQHVC